MTPQAQVDLDRVKMFMLQVFMNLSGAMVSAMIYLGDRLGLYRALASGGALTSSELAAATGLHERWVREWLYSQGAARLLTVHDGERFELSGEGSLVLADENSPFFSAGGFHSLPQQVALLEPLMESFRTGVGLPYDTLGREGAIGIERFLAPWFRSFLVPLALPALDGVVEKLKRGALVADIGCGAGVALIEMAKAFPSSEFHGYDISQHALERARENAAADGLENIVFHDAAAEPLAEDGSLDLITTFDCLHDMTHPADVMRTIRAAIAPDGTWFIADINARPTFAENMERNPMAAMMYGTSVLNCMSSALSTADGAGLGTLGFSEQLAREMTRAAGFTRFRRHDFDNPVNAFYEVRP